MKPNRDKENKPSKLISACCQSEMITQGTGSPGSTNWYECTKCGHPCDVWVDKPSKKTLRENRSYGEVVYIQFVQDIKDSSQDGITGVVRNGNYYHRRSDGKFYSVNTFSTTEL